MKILIYFLLSFSTIHSLHGQEFLMRASDWAFAIPSGYFGSATLSDDTYITAVRDLRTDTSGSAYLNFYYFKYGISIDTFTTLLPHTDTTYTYNISNIVSDGRYIYYKESMHLNTSNLIDYISDKWKRFDPQNKVIENLPVQDQQLPGYYSALRYDAVSNSIVANHSRYIYTLNLSSLNTPKKVIYNDYADEIMIDSGNLWCYFGNLYRYNLLNNKLDTFNPPKDYSKRSGGFHFAIKSDSIIVMGKRTNYQNYIKDFVISSFTLQATSQKDHIYKSFTHGQFPCAYQSNNFDEMTVMKNGLVTSSFYTMGDDSCSLLFDNIPHKPNWYGLLVSDFAANIYDTIAYRSGFTELEMKQILNDSTIAIGGQKYIAPYAYYFVRFIKIPNYNTNTVHDPLNYSSITIYPNPVRDELHLQMSEFRSGRILRIIDASGRVISQHPVTLDDSIPVSDLTPGIYYLQCRQRDGSVTGVGRFVKI